MVEHNGKPKIKVSNNPTKTTNPGAKKVVRFYSEEGLMEADALAAVAEDLRNGEVEIIDPINPLRRKRLRETSRVELLRDIVIDGQLVYDFPSMEGIRTRRVDQLNHLHDSYKRLHNPHEYKVGLTFSLWQQKEGMLTQRVS
jgi:nicotinate phosphoribosyltransferase